MELSIKKAITATEAFKDSIIVFIESSSTSDLIDYFDFECGFEIVDAIQYYRELELFNACQALENLLLLKFQDYINSL